MKQAIIFDLDGTLLDTLEDLTDSTNYALVNNNLPQRDINEIRRFVGNGIYKLIQRAVPQGTDEVITKKCFDEFCTHYKGNMENKTKPYDGINNLLKTLSQNGFKMAIVTNKADFAAQKLCKSLFGEYIDLVVGSVDDRPNKPSPDGVFYALEQLGCEKDYAVFIGDSEVDIATAQNAEMDSIGVLWGFRTKEDLQKVGVNETAQTVEELEKMLLNAKNK